MAAQSATSPRSARCAASCSLALRITHFGPTPTYSANSRCSLRTDRPDIAASWSTRVSEGSPLISETMSATLSATGSRPGSSRVRNSSARATVAASLGASMIAACAASAAAPNTSAAGIVRSVSRETGAFQNGRNPPGLKRTPSALPRPPIRRTNSLRSTPKTAEPDSSNARFTLGCGRIFCSYGCWPLRSHRTIQWKSMNGRSAADGRCRESWNLPAARSWCSTPRPSPCSLAPFTGSQGRGARAARFPIPLSIRTCGFPAYGLPMIFLTWLRCLRVADGAGELVQAEPVQPFLCPLADLSGAQVPAAFLDQKTFQAPRDVPVDLAELGGGVPGAEVVAPAAQQRVDIRDHFADVFHPHAVAAGSGPDLVPEPLHRLLRGPAVQVVADDPLLLPQPPRHAGVKVTAEEIQTLPASCEVHNLRLIRVQLQPQRSQDLPDHFQGRPGLCLRAAQRHAIIGVAHQLTHATRGELRIQDVQANIGQQRGNHPALRRPSDRPLKLPVIRPPWRQPQAAKLEHPPVRHPLPDPGEQPVMADLAEEVADIKLRDELAALDETGTKPLHRLRGRPPRPEPVRARQEIRLEDRLQHDLGRLLGHPIPHGGDA